MRRSQQNFDKIITFKYANTNQILFSTKSWLGFWEFPYLRGFILELKTYHTIYICTGLSRRYINDTLIKFYLSFLERNYKSAPNMVTNHTTPQSGPEIEAFFKTLFLFSSLYDLSVLSIVFQMPWNLNYKK